MAASAASRLAEHEEKLSFWRKYVFSVDHKVIGKQYLFLSLFMALVGGTLAYMLRWQMAWPETPVPGMSWIPEPTAFGGIVPPEFYNAIVKIRKGTYESFEADLATLMRIRIKNSFLLQDGTEKLVVEFEDVPFRFGKKPLRFGDNDHFEVLVTFKAMSQNNIDLRCHFYAMTTDRVVKPSN